MISDRMDTLHNVDKLPEFVFICSSSWLATSFVYDHDWRCIFHDSRFSVFLTSCKSFLVLFTYCIGFVWKLRNFLQIIQQNAHTSRTEELTGTEVMAHLLRDFIPGSASSARLSQAQPGVTGVMDGKTQPKTG